MIFATDLVTYICIMGIVIGGGSSCLGIDIRAFGVVVCCTGCTFKVDILSFNKSNFLTTSLKKWSPCVLQVQQFSLIFVRWIIAWSLVSMGYGKEINLLCHNF